ncbi:MAG: PKD domain-containing protein [Chloroflexi bacterium]|nr:PKD domain-containing protein [Chloroflexota bacterium]
MEAGRRTETGGSSELQGRRRRGRNGQSLAEFALILPVFLLLTLIAIDFGRVYLGWVNLQNMARVAANFAANHPTAWVTNDASAKASYQNQILADAKANNCTLPLVSGAQTAPDPTFPGGNAIGGTAEVRLTCTFRIITPIISAVVGSGGNLTVGASSVFPIKTAMFSIGGGGPVAPTANFTGTPTSVTEGSSVQFTDSSTGSPTSWAWTFGDGGTSTAQNPVHPYATAGTYSVTLTATNAVGSSAPFTRTNYISVTVVPPTVDFTGIPVAGNAPLTVAFSGTSSLPPSSVLWTFGDGTTSSTGLTVNHTYAAAGTFTVKLTVTTANGPGSLTRSNYITVNVGSCTVPDFIGSSSANAQATWNAAGFTTTVTYKQGGLPWTIKSQTLVGGLSVPCNSTIQVSKT